MLHIFMCIKKHVHVQVNNKHVHVYSARRISHIAMYTATTTSSSANNSAAAAAAAAAATTTTTTSCV